MANTDITNLIDDRIAQAAPAQRAYDQKILRKSLTLDNPYSERWIDLSSHTVQYPDPLNPSNPPDPLDFNTDVTVNVEQNTPVMVNCQISASENNGFFYVRLGKKVDGQIIWGTHPNGIFPDQATPIQGDLNTRNDDLEDPKGDKDESPGNTNNRVEAWDHVFCKSEENVETMTPHFIDMDPTNGQSGKHSVTYFIRIHMEYPDSSGPELPEDKILCIGSTYSSDNTIFASSPTCIPTILTAVQL